MLSRGWPIRQLRLVMTMSKSRWLKGTLYAALIFLAGAATGTLLAPWLGRTFMRPPQPRELAFHMLDRLQSGLHLTDEQKPRLSRSSKQPAQIWKRFAARPPLVCISGLGKQTSKSPRSSRRTRRLSLTKWKKNIGNGCENIISNIIITLGFHRTHRRRRRRGDEYEGTIRV